MRINLLRYWKRFDILHDFHWNLELAELLVAKGADVNVKDERGIPLLWTIVPYATNNGRGFQKHTVDAIKLLLAAGADLNYKDREGKTVLESMEARKETFLDKENMEVIIQMLKGAIARKQG